MENTTNETLETMEQEQETTEKTFTADEVAKLVQSEADKRVNQALAKQKKDYDKKLSLSKLDDNEREKAEKDNRIAELEQKLAEYQIEHNKSELKSVLSSRGLSAEFADIILISDDLETSQANIDKLDKLFKTAVKNEVEKRLGGQSPRGNGTKSTPMTKEEYLKLPITEMQRLHDSNPTFFDNLLKN